MLPSKDFKELAKILRECKADGVMIRELADFCYESNPNFDRGRFYHACEVDL